MIAEMQLRRTSNRGDARRAAETRTAVARTAVLLAIFLAGHLAGTLHQVLVQHTVCEVHGTLRHGSAGCDGAPTRSTDVGGIDDSHCSAEPGVCAQATPIPLTHTLQPASARAMQPWPAGPARIAAARLWMLAPKTSPPPPAA